MEKNESFDSCADQYERMRPGYPEWIREFIECHAVVGPGRRLLEIGCGTGKATVLFADSGASIECVDLGGNMLAIAREKFAGYSNVSFREARFEELEMEPASFDLIYSAAAYHWIKQPAGNVKVRELLKKDGRFALIGNHHVGLDEGFFLDAQPIYDSVGMFRKNDPAEEAEIERSRHIDESFFRIVAKKTVSWEKRCSADEYIDLIFTYSDHITMKAEHKDRFKREVRDLINARYGGFVTKKFEMRVEIGTPV